MERLLRPCEGSGESFDKLTMNSDEGRSKSACALPTLGAAKPSLPSSGQRSERHEIAVNMGLSPCVQVVEFTHFFPLLS